MIIRAALRVFARSGFHGTTTRALARAAGVSEALIFRHFPTKDDLYAALQEECCGWEDEEDAGGGSVPVPSTATLVATVHGFVARMVAPPATAAAVAGPLHRLMVHSFMEDGHFARQFMQRVAADLIVSLEASVAAAERAGDLVASPVRQDLRAWFAEHFAAMLMLNLLPGRPVVDFRLPAPELVEQATWFALLGMGMKATAIRRHLPAGAGLPPIPGTD